jgi:hypothetical protein
LRPFVADISTDLSTDPSAASSLPTLRCDLMAKVRTPPIYTTPTDAALAFYQAFEAKDVDAMMTTWAEDEEIVCVHPAARGSSATTPCASAGSTSSLATPGSRSAWIRW